MPLIDPVTMSEAASSSGSQPRKKSLPIELLPTDLARIVTHVHPVLLLAAYYVRFSALVANPTHALSTSLLPLAVVQISYAICCLPAAGSSSRLAKKQQKSKPGVGKKIDALAVSPLPIFLAFILSIFSIPVLAAVQILFGAPITTHLPQTLLSSSHLALLAVFPLVYVHGVDSAKWRELASAYSPIDEVFGATLGAFLGAWLGAVPIPLDWDREWQKWPVTIVTGVYAGYAVGKLVGAYLLKGKRIEFD